MYNILFYENGQFCTNIGGLVPTLPEAVAQTKRLAASLQAEELEGYFGYKFERYGTPCAILVADRWGAPIRNVEGE